MMNFMAQPDILEAPFRRGGFRFRRRFPFRSRFPFRGGFLWPEIVIAPSGPYSGSVDDEVNALVQRNQCLFLRRQGSPDLIRGEVVNALKARGWEERLEVFSAGGFSVKIVKLCPPSAVTALTPVPMVPAVQPAAVSGLGRIRLGEVSSRLRVVVLDRRAKTASGIKITVLSPDNIGSGITDDDGVVLVDLPSGRTEAVVVADLPEGEVRQRILLSPLGTQTVTFQSVRKIGSQLVTPVEGAAAGVGVGMIILGTVLGDSVGDILAGIGGSVTAAAVYSSVSRNV